MEFEKGNIALARRIQRDLEYNTKFKRTIEAYWLRLGHKVTVEVAFNPINKVYQVRSDLKNGYPQGALTAKCRDTVLKLEAPSPYGG